MNNCLVKHLKVTKILWICLRNFCEFPPWALKQHGHKRGIFYSIQFSLPKIKMKYDLTQLVARTWFGLPLYVEGVGQIVDSLNCYYVSGRWLQQSAFEFFCSKLGPIFFLSLERKENDRRSMSDCGHMRRVCAAKDRTKSLFSLSRSWKKKKFTLKKKKFSLKFLDCALLQFW